MPYYCKAFTEADAKVTPSVKGKSFFLEPFFGWSRQERFFFVRKVDGGYELEGELYLIDKQDSRKYINSLKKELKQDKATVEFRLLDENYRTVAVCKMGDSFEDLIKKG